MKKVLKIIIIGVGILALCLLFYITYLFLSYNRIPDNQTLEINNNQNQMIELGKTYQIMTWNIGFGAYSKDYSFFMDENHKKDGTYVQGKYARGKNKKDVLNNLTNMLNMTNEQNPDFIFLQEIDTNSTRSYGINQVRLFQEELNTYGSSYASNFHTPFLLYPVLNPHGQVNSGITTFSKYKIENSTRKQLPITNHLIDKLFELDRAIIVTRIETEENDLILINVHLSAYDKGGIYREKQIEYLKQVMEDEYKRGNYVIVGGDFNHDMINNLYQFPTIYEVPDWISTFDQNSLPDGFSIISDNATPSVRSAEQPYQKGENFLGVVDAFLVSDNIDVHQIKNINTDFLYSDHHPAVMTFSLLTKETDLQ